MLGTVSLPNIPSSNSLVVKDAEMLPATTSSLGSSGTMGVMSPMDSAFAIFSEMRDSLQQVVENTGKTVELLTSLTSLETNEAIQDQREERADSIGRGETDEPKEKGPGVLSKVGGALQSINPFSEKFGFGTFGKLILAGATPRKVTFKLLLLNCFYCWPAAWMTYTYRDYSLLILLVVYVTLSLVWYHLRERYI